MNVHAHPPLARRAAWLLVFALLAPTAIWAADKAKPHPHQGVLKPYPRPPAPLVLSDAERQQLQSGKSIMRQTEGEASGRGLSIFRVHAPPDVSWAIINNFKSYTTYIPEVKEIEVYQKRGPGQEDVRFKIGSWGVEIEYFIRHEFDMANRWGTWTLDYSRESDLSDSVGFWRVTPIEGEPDWSLVEYSVDIAIKGWVPGFVRTMLVDDGLKTATQWVKKYAEKKYTRMKSEGAIPAVSNPAAPAAAVAP